eukprot:2293939-Rhodomonas_salina.1
MCGACLHIQLPPHSITICRPGYTLGSMGTDAQTSVAAHGLPCRSNVRPPARARTGRHHQEPTRCDTGQAHCGPNPQTN